MDGRKPIRRRSESREYDVGVVNKKKRIIICEHENNTVKPILCIDQN